MSDAPHKFSFHIGDYLRDTEDLSMAQHGAYLRLMLWYYSTAKPLPNDLDRIYRRTGALSREDKASAEFVLTEFFALRDGKWVHKRIEQELADWGIATQCARESANKRWDEFRKNKAIEEALALDAHKNGTANPDASLLPVTSYLIPKSKSLAQNPAGFARFWAAYPKKRSKGDALKAWKVIRPPDDLVDSMLEAIARSVTSPDWIKDRGQFIPYPATWLRAAGWDDEEIQFKGTRGAAQLIPCKTCGAQSSDWWLNGRYCEAHIREARDHV